MTSSSSPASAQVALKLSDTWPPEGVAAIGAFPDFPDVESLRSGYGREAARGVTGLNRQSDPPKTLTVRPSANRPDFASNWKYAAS